jgi:hypothetical protein
MKTDQTNQGPTARIFYSITIADREFDLILDSHGILHVSDSQRVSLPVLRGELPTENTVLVRCPESLSKLLQQADAISEANDHRRTPEGERAEQLADGELVPFFWQEVNSKLFSPIPERKRDERAEVIGMFAELAG